MLLSLDTAGGEQSENGVFLSLWSMSLNLVGFMGPAVSTNVREKVQYIIICR